MWSLAVLTAVALFPLMNPLGALPLFAALTDDDTAGQRKSMAFQSAMYSFFILAVTALIGTGLLNLFGLSLGMLQVAGGLIIGHTAWVMATGSPKQSSSGTHKKDKKSLLAWAQSSTSAIVTGSVEHLKSATDQSLHPIKTIKKAKHSAAPAGDDAAPGEGDNAQPAPANISFSPMAMPMLAGPGSMGIVIGIVTQHTGSLDMVGILIGILIMCVVSWICLLMATPINRTLGPGGVMAMQRIFGFIVLGIAVSLIATGISSLWGLHLVD